MPISVARKLQALRDQRFPDLDVQVQPVALTPAQVKEYGLPSTPLKESERRSDRWKAKFGVEQTEIDALAALKPGLLRRLADEAIAPFFDETLWRRCRRAQDDYQSLADEAFADIAPDHIGGLVSQAEALRAEIREKVDALNDEMADAIRVIDLGLPPPEVPKAEVSGDPVAEVIFSTDWHFADASRRLRDRKRYIDDEAQLRLQPRLRKHCRDAIASRKPMTSAGPSSSAHPRA